MRSHSATGLCSFGLFCCFASLGTLLMGRLCTWTLYLYELFSHLLMNSCYGYSVPLWPWVARGEVAQGRGNWCFPSLNIGMTECLCHDEPIAEEAVGPIV